MYTSKENEIEIMRVHNLFWESYAKRDVELRFALCSDDVTFIGSGLHERANNKEEYKKINEEGVKQYPTPFQINFLWTKLSMLTENVASVESEVVWTQQINNEVVKELLRNTTLLKRDNSNWLVTHVHGSVPDYRLKDGDYMTNEQTIIRNRELERQVFERTEELNKTLKEIEKKNRELEIEAALERVRSKAMAMHNSENLLDTISEFFVQLKILNIMPVRCGVAQLFDNPPSWTAAATNATIQGDSVQLSGKVEHLNHPVLKGIYDHWIKQENYFPVLQGEEIKEYYKALRPQINIPEFPEGEIHHGHYFNFREGNIFAWTKDPLSEEEKSIFARFSSVLSLTYRRYIDLKKAEAQAREAQIEAALERVRSRTMGMQKSEELKEMIKLVYDQLVHLNINVDHAGFVVDYTPKGDWHFWIADKNEIPSKITHPYFDSVWANQFNEAKEIGIDFFTTNLNFKEKNKFYNELLSYVPGLPEKSKDFYLSCPGLAITTVLFDSVSLYIENFSGTPYNDEENKILMRFGKVFQQTYTRFLDLQKAEAQAREAQIETALERVRSKAMAMNSSEDLATAVDTFFTELNKLGIVPHRCGVGIVDSETRIADIRATVFTKEGVSKKIVGKLKLAGHPVLDKVFENWKSKQEYHPILLGNEISDYYKVMNPQVEFPDFADDEIQYGHYFQFKEGGVFAWTDRELKEEELQIFRRYTSVLSLTYRRYSELKEAEAQARESKIESVLERVRAKAMAMHSSNDLSDTMGVLFRELPKLGIFSLRCGVVLLSESSTQGVFHAAATTRESDDFTMIGTGDMMSHPVFTKQYENWLQKKNYFVSLSSNELQSYYKEIFNRVSKTYNPKDHKLQTEHGYYFSFSEGMFYAWSDEPYSEESINILNRFKAIFDLTFRRYLDLQNAETQNKIIQAENDRKTKELEEARQLQLSLLPKDLPKLPNLEIAAFMRTATEVAGDYYDFVVQENGTLNIGFGDATGHGLQAGTMITLMKGFFTSDAAKLAPNDFMNHCNNMIKEIKLGRILMSFTFLKFDKDNKLYLSSAGMPPVFYFNYEKKEIEEILLQEVPLGAMKRYSYKILEKHLRKGDTILLLTDGLPEQVNKDGVAFDYEQVKNHFLNLAEVNPDEIVDHLISLVDKWMDGTTQDDDITFLVIKVK